MSTRCKVTCDSVTKIVQERDRESGRATKFGWSAEMRAVYGDSKENKEFFLYTPSASFKLTTLREDTFQPGREYYVDFTEVELPAVPS